jgi:hypothetical protein
MNSDRKTFDVITKVIAHPHKAITGHDRIRAAAILEILSTEGPASMYSCLLQADKNTREQALILLKKL